MLEYVCPESLFDANGVRADLLCPDGQESLGHEIFQRFRSFVDLEAALRAEAGLLGQRRPTRRTKTFVGLGSSGVFFLWVQRGSREVFCPLARHFCLPDGRVRPPRMTMPVCVGVVGENGVDDVGLPHVLRHIAIHLSADAFEFHHSQLLERRPCVPMVCAAVVIRTHCRCTRRAVIAFWVSLVLCVSVAIGRPVVVEHQAVNQLVLAAFSRHTQCPADISQLSDLHALERRSVEWPILVTHCSCYGRHGGYWQRGGVVHDIFAAARSSFPK
mmetsp:Transcript_8756/g.25071  ORF Transcript_8756/g.25071 Transcript_8756/m.25071 type:complete len:272 (+) Transcript_8756:1346-2161(+)